MTAPLFDTHCHLAFEAFGDDFGDVVVRAKEAGVGALVTIGAGEGISGAQGAVACAEKLNPWVWASVGVHPHEASILDEAARDVIATLAEHRLVVAIGETGLDRHYNLSPDAAQDEGFRWHIALAKRVKKPIIVHTRNAPEDTLRILREENAKDVGGIIHCFSEDPSFAKSALDLGFISSFSGLVTFPKGTDKIREAARTQPADAILVETDAPYLAPVPFRGKRNEPAYVAKTAAFLATLRGEDEDRLREQTTRNACRIFNVPPPLTTTA